MDRDRNSIRPFGVLFVDGFREQRPGSALALLASALYRWLSRWQAGSKLAQEQGQDQLGLSEAMMSDADASGDEQPPHLTLTVPRRLDTGEMVSESWLLAESSWTSLFAPPQFLGMARWIWKVSTCLLVLQFVIPMRRHWNQARSDGASSFGRLAGVSVAGAYLVLMAAAAVMSVLMSLALLVLAVASYLPIPRIDEAVHWVVVHVSAILGDSYTLAHCPVQFAAMRTRVGRDLHWMQDRCGGVAVIAHSQGAAIVHHLLKEDARCREGLAGLVTLGQGISKLDLMQRLDWDPQARTAAWQSRTLVTTGMVAAGLPALGLVAAQWLGLPSMRELAVFPVTAGLLLVGFICLGLGVRRAMLAVCPELAKDLSLPGDGYIWSDYYASADPVSNGPLPRGEDEQAAGESPPLLPGPCEEVFNSGSILFDHNGYLRNQDELIPKIMNDLERAAAHTRHQADVDSQLVHPDDIAASSHRRQKLVRYLIGARIAAGCLFVTLWWADPGPALRRPLDGLSRLLSPHAMMGGDTARLVASLIITAVYYALAVTAWRLMLGRSVERFFKTAHRDRESSPSTPEAAPASRPAAATLQET